MSNMQNGLSRSSIIAGPINSTGIIFVLMLTFLGSDSLTALKEVDHESQEKACEQSCISLPTPIISCKRLGNGGPVDRAM
jgi:hypothetical protein